METSKYCTFLMSRRPLKLYLLPIIWNTTLSNSNHVWQPLEGLNPNSNVVKYGPTLLRTGKELTTTCILLRGLVPIIYGCCSSSSLGKPMNASSMNWLLVVLLQVVCSFMTLSWSIVIYERNPTQNVSRKTHHSRTGTPSCERALMMESTGLSISRQKKKCRSVGAALARCRCLFTDKGTWLSILSNGAIRRSRRTSWISTMALLGGFGYN